MNKNEELQKWLNDDRYVQLAELTELWNLSKSGVSTFLCRSNIKAIKRFAVGRRGRYYFFNKQQCADARSMFESKVQDIKQLSADNTVITTKELAILWGISRDATRAFIYVRRIKPIKNINVGHGCSAFYDRAECERARPFINQPKKEVEKVENIGELATATKYQILCETGADNFVWDKVTMKHKIMPVKNYCDERGNFVSLFKKDEAVSAILAYKNEQKQLLEKCLADKNLVTTKDLETIWNCKKSNVYSKIYKLEIKPHVKVKLENGYIWHFYKKSDCIESQKVEEVKQVNLPEPKEQSPDIIPADTIDLFTMSELETELKNRGVELTDEVKAKINASDMPEMQEIATMLRGNAKTIAIRLSVLNEIAGQLKSAKKLNFYEKMLAKFEPKQSPLDSEYVSKDEKKEILKTMHLTTEQKKVFCIIKEMTASGISEIRQGAVAKKLSSKYNIGYAGARVSVSRAVKNMEIKGYIARPSFGVVLIPAEYINADIVETRFIPKSEVQKQPTNIKSKHKLDLIMSRLEEISLLRKEIAELKQMMIENK